MQSGQSQILRQLGRAGLLAFALVIWRYLPAHNPWVLAMAAWTLVSGALWALRKQPGPTPARDREFAARSVPWAAQNLKNLKR